MTVFQQQPCCDVLWCAVMCCDVLWCAVLNAVTLIVAEFRRVRVGQENVSTVLSWIRLKELNKLKDTVGIINALFEILTLYCYSTSLGISSASTCASILRREGKSVNGLIKPPSKKQNKLRHFISDTDETSSLGWKLCEEIRQKCT
jgi:hypothetical protein